MKAGHKRLRVVLDTNILVSALGFSGRIRRIWDLVEENAFDVFLSPFILEELERNLIEQVDLTEDKAEVIIDVVRNLAQIVEPKTRVTAIPNNNSDNKILECAIEAKADLIVTGNMKHIRPLGVYKGIVIMTPREFLDKYFPDI